MPRIQRLLRGVGVLPRPARRLAARLVARSRSPFRLRKAEDLLLRTEPTIDAVHHWRRRLMASEELAMLGLPEGLGVVPPWDPLPDAGAFPLARLRILELRHYMGNTLLRDSDVFGMAHGLEIRVPLLSQPLVDYMLSLPDAAWRRRGAINKRLLVNGAGGAALTASRRTKRGFGLPFHRWMLGHLRPFCEAALESVRRSGLVEPSGVTAMWNDFVAEGEGPGWSRVWALTVLGDWLSRGRAESLARVS